MKRVSLELGGKSPMIICKDADLEQAAMACHTGLFLNMGQCCVASSRIFIHEDIHDAFAAKVVAMAKRLRTQGDVSSETDNPNCDLGPQVDKIQFDKILGYIEKGKQEGATLALGGGRVGSKGFYVQPTVFTDVTDDMTIAREEIFGPVMQLMKFKSLEDAIKRANTTHYGLAAGICTRDVGLRWRLHEILMLARFGSMTTTTLTSRHLSAALRRAGGAARNQSRRSRPTPRARL